MGGAPSDAGEAVVFFTLRSADGSGGQVPCLGEFDAFLAIIWKRMLTSILTQGQHYTMALIDCVYDIGRVIERMGEMNSGLRWEIEELKGKPGPMAVATVV